MAFFPFNRKQEKRSSKRSPAIDPSDGKSQLTLELEAVKRKRQEILAKTEETRRKVEDIPKQIAERKRREQKLIHERAQNHKTVRGLGKPTYRIPSVVTRKMTRGQERSMTAKLLILCAVLGVMLLILWRAAS